MATRTTEGFDLDAVVGNGEDGEDVIYELGGGVTRLAVETPQEQAVAAAHASEAPPSPETQEPHPLAEALEYKQEGNARFKNGEFLEAYDLYTSAIEAVPGMTGPEVVKLEEEHLKQEAATRRRLLDAQAAMRSSNTQTEEKASDASNTNNHQTTAKDAALPPPVPFCLDPPHPHAQDLAVFYANRAAVLIQLERYQEAVDDAHVALLVQPTYTKAYMRRATAYEKLNDGKTDLALQDAKKALELEPRNADIRKTVLRLEKVEAERLEKLKEETLGKLKDLGNSILGNFGMSLDNFKAEKDPQTGSYSISFNQNK